MQIKGKENSHYQSIIDGEEVLDTCLLYAWREREKKKGADWNPSIGLID